LDWSTESIKELSLHPGIMANRMIESTFGTPGNLEVVTLDGGNPAKLVHLFRGQDLTWELGLQSAEVISSQATSSGAIIQSSFGTPAHPGNFEVLVLEGSNLVHYFKDNSNTSNPWVAATPHVVSSKATGGASFIQSTFKTTPNAPGNFEAVVLEGSNLVHYFKDNSNPQNPWVPTTVISPNATSPGCIIQSTLGSSKEHGNFELVVLEGRNLVHYWRDNSRPDYPWTRATVISNDAVSQASLIQSNLGVQGAQTNLELVVPEGNELSEQQELAAYFRDDSTQPYLWHRTGTVSNQSQSAACLIQGRYGVSPGNFELVVVEGAEGAHSLDHYWRNNEANGFPWSSPDVAVRYPFDSSHIG
jgi:hypothetical protein